MKYSNEIEVILARAKNIALGCIKTLLERSSSKSVSNDEDDVCILHCDEDGNISNVTPDRFLLIDDVPYVEYDYNMEEFKVPLRDLGIQDVTNILEFIEDKIL